MTAPAMPSPSRVVNSSIAFMIRRGYTKLEARKITMHVIESLGKADAHWQPWQLEWLRGLYRAADTYGGGGLAAMEEAAAARRPGEGNQP